MADIQSYERVLKKDMVKLKFVLVAVYATILSIWLVLAMRFGIHPAMIFMCPLSLFIAVILTWKYTNVEYEYSFIAGTLSFSKIYGKSQRKPVLEADIKKFIEVLPYNERTAPKVGSDRDSCVIDGLPSGELQNPCYCVFEDDKDRKVYFLFECDEQTAKILKFFNSPATDRSVFDKLK